MSHEQQANFCRRVRAMKPQFFKEMLVLDVGSLDINGNNRFLFENCIYLGVDLAPGHNVDIISPIHQLGLPDATFDTIVSTECFEHDMHWDKSLQNIVRMLKPGGLLFFSCATTGRPEHGTRRTTPTDAPLLQDINQWNDYYRNLEIGDICSAIDVDAVFSSYSFETQDETSDLYFWGIKAGQLNKRNDYSFLMESDAADSSHKPTQSVTAGGNEIDLERRLRAELSEHASQTKREALELIDSKLGQVLIDGEQRSEAFGAEIAEIRLQMAQTPVPTTHVLHADLEAGAARTDSQLSAMESAFSQRIEERDRAHEMRSNEVGHRIENVSGRLTYVLSQLSAMESSFSRRIEERDRAHEVSSNEVGRRIEKLSDRLTHVSSQLSAIESSISQSVGELNRRYEGTSKEMAFRIEGLSSRLTHALSQLSAIEFSLSKRLDERDQVHEISSNEVVYRVEGLSGRLTHTLKMIEAVERTTQMLAGAFDVPAKLNGVESGSWSVEKLLGLWDEAFVESAYGAILGHHPDDESRARWLGLVRDGESREDILCDMALSAKGQDEAQLIPGLPALMERYTSADGPLDRVQTNFVSPLSKYLCSLENHIKGVEARIPDLVQSKQLIEAERTKTTLDFSVPLLADRQIGLRRNGKSRVGILTTPHCFFVARLIAAHLRSLGFDCPISTKEPKGGFEDIFYFVICPQMFPRLPGLYIAFQMEQSVSSRWFSKEYFGSLESAAFVLDYSIRNILFLRENKLAFSHVYYLPIGYLSSYCSHAKGRPLETDVLFYGDANNDRRRRILADLRSRFQVRVISEVFGEELIEAIARARIVVNIHYYEGALLETTRIYECLSLHRIIVSEESVDMDEHDDLNGLVDFVEIGDVDAIADRISFWLDHPEAQATRRKQIESTLEKRNNRFGFYFNRFLLASDVISFEEFWRLSGRHFELGSQQVCLTLPETPLRGQAFKAQGKSAFRTVPGLRHVRGWIGCGLSYKWLASLARQERLSTLAICEDDTTFPPEFDERWAAIMSRLSRNHGEWDVFSGFMADVSRGANISAAQSIAPHGELLLLDQMISTVFNVYAPTALTLIEDWDPTNREVEANTVDRYLERSARLRVVLSYPFLVDHQDDLTSAVWGFENSQYTAMIESTLALLSQRLEKMNRVDIFARSAPVTAYADSGRLP